MIIIEKVCFVCGNMRKFLKNTPRDIHTICGECWNWNLYPNTLDPDQVNNKDSKDLVKPGLVYSPPK